MTEERKIWTDGTKAAEAAYKNLGEVIRFLYKMEEKYPNENWEDEALEPIRCVTDALAGWGPTAYRLYGKKDDAL